MGSAIASHLLSKGYEVHGFNRSPDRTVAIKEKGGIIHASAKELAAAVDVLITSLTDENAVQQLALGKDGILSTMNKNAVWMEMSTIDPDASVALAQEAERLGLAKLDVPIVDPPEVEMQGKVMPLVGGKKELFQRYEPLLNDLGRYNDFLLLGDNFGRPLAGTPVFSRQHALSRRADGSSPHRDSLWNHRGSLRTLQERMDRQRDMGAMGRPG